MNWRQVLGRLPLNIVKNLNREATREAQRQFNTYAFRCHVGEDYCYVEYDDQMGACLKAQEKGWRAHNLSPDPYFVKLIWFCPKDAN